MTFFPNSVVRKEFHRFFLPCQPPLLFQSGLAWSVFPTLLCARRWNSVEIEFQNPSLAARPRPSASLIISVNLLIKMSCKRFPSFHSDHYQHARPPAEYRSFSPLPALHTFQRSSKFLNAPRCKTAQKMKNLKRTEILWACSTFWQCLENMRDKKITSNS